MLSLNNATGMIQQVTVIDVTITCHMSFRRFPFEAQSCPFEVLDVERPPVGIFKMVTSEIQFSNWPHSFSPTESEFEYKVQGVFFNWCPPKKLKYLEPRLGESTST